MNQINPYAGYWTPGQFIFLKEQVKWYMENFELMRTGNWPLDPNNVRSENLSPHAYFELITGIWMEFSTRLETTGRDGKIAISHYAYQMEDGDIAELTGCEYGKVKSKYGRAVAYMASRKRRERSYDDFCNHPRHKRPPVFSYNDRRDNKNIKENLGGETMEPETISSGLTTNRGARSL